MLVPLLQTGGMVYRGVYFTCQYIVHYRPCSSAMIVSKSVGHKVYDLKNSKVLKDPLAEELIAP